MVKILFVSNEGARTGAPAIMLALIQWLKAHTSIEATNVLMRDGALREEFEKLGTTYAWDPPDLNKPDRLHRRMAKVLQQRSYADPGTWLARIVEREQPDIIYLSTLVLGKYLGGVSVLPKRRVITHVHELLPSLRQLSNDSQVRTQLNLSDKVISCARCVESTLIREYELPNAKSIIIPEFIALPESKPAEAGRDSATAPEAKGSAGEALGKIQHLVDRGAAIFGIGGNPIARKGFDLVALLIKECKLLFTEQPFLFIWLGCSDHSAPHASIDWDLRNLGLSEHFMAVPSLPMPQFRQILSKLQVLTLLSREDPFPLVALEAGLLGIPTVCFEGSGAIAEMADEGCCQRVAYLDIPAFAAAVHRLCRHQQEAKAIAEACRMKVTQELSLEIVAPQVAAVLLDTPVNERPQKV